MNKENLPSNSVKMFWEDVPPQEDQMKNVLSAATYCEPGNVINSTHVHVEAKPWLQKGKLKRKAGKMAAIPQAKQTTFKSKPSIIKKQATENLIKIVNNDEVCETVTKTHMEESGNVYKECSLSQLRKEDKQRVADLVREMAKFSEEKELAVQELTSLKTDFSTKLKSLEVEKQKMINEKDVLKEKLLRYELILKEIKEKQKEGNGKLKNVDSILKNHASLHEFTLDAQCFENIDSIPPEKVPGNIRVNKHSKDEEYAPLIQPKLFEQGNISENHLSEVNGLADLFFKQQDKFHHQQEILQKQIEQLQQLQESILEQQLHQIKETQEGNKLEQKNSKRKQAQKGMYNEESYFEKSGIGKHSIQLQEYIQKQPTEMDKEDIQKKICKSPNILVSDTLIDDSKENTLVSVHCLNATNKSSKVDSAVQTLRNIHVPTNVAGEVLKDLSVPTSKVDQCVETDKLLHDNLNEMSRLDSCESHISKLEQTLKDLSSKVVPEANINSATKKKCKVQKGKFATQLCSTNGSEKKDSSENSALQRGHFRPASMLDLIEGLQPPSASTSIDHSSFQNISPPNRNVSRRTPLSPIKQKSCMKPLLSSGKLCKSKTEFDMKKSCSAVNCKQDQGVIKQRTSEDQEELDMLADIFFIS